MAENLVMFKKGLQENLPATGVIENGFYLTTDTHRLYTGYNGTTVLLNSAIAFYNSPAELEAASKQKQFQPAVGDIAFVGGDYNALMLNLDGTATGWHQINRDKNDNNFFETTNLAFEKVADNDDNSVTYKLTLTQTDENNSTSTVTANFTISAEDIGAIIADDTMSASSIEDGANIQLDNETDDGVNLIAGENVSIDVTGDNITISAVDEDTTYDLTSPAGENKIHLKGTDQSDDVVELIAGEQIALDGSKADKITINHGTIAVTATPVNSDGGILTHEGEFTVVDGITIGTNGHVTSYATKTYTLPKDNDTTNASMTAAADNAGKMTITLTDSATNEVIATSGQDLYVTVGEEIVYNQNNILDTEYFKNLDEQIGIIEKDLAGIDALRYKGVVDATHSLPGEKIQVGDTYKVGAAGTYSNIKCEVGDLLIAIGTEGEDGYIASNLEWTHIAAGDDTDTTYDLICNATGNLISLVASTGDQDDIKVVSGKQVVATVAAKSDNAPATLTVAHADITRNDGTVVKDSLEHQDTFTVVTNVTSDNGHVTAVETTEFTLPEDNDTKYTLPVKFEGDAGVITLTGTDGSTDVVNFKAGNSNTSLTVNVENDAVIYKHADYTYEGNPAIAGGALTHEGTFTVVSGATIENGHITALTTAEYTLPKDNETTYTLSGATVTVANNTATAVSTLTGTDNKSSTSTVVVSSESLSIAAVSGKTNAYAIDLTWGTF